MNLGNGTYSYAASFDTGMRLTSASLTNTSSSTQLYQTQPAYDAVNNVVSVQTSVSGQTDSQQFCYDDLYRLTWAGTNGTPPCSGTAITAGTLTAAQYQQSDSYDVDGRLTGGPGGSYTYGDNSHPHAVTSTSNGYSAAYDAAGDMTCRALTAATTCSGTPTGQQLSYDAEGRLSSWQNQPASPAQTANYLYDGAGKRVAMQSTVNGTTTLTAYIGSIEEVQTTANTTQTTTYYTVGSKRIAAAVNGTFYYFGYDALGSQVVVLNSSGTVIGAQLYGPYGSSRYSTGILPTSIGFTGQLTDSVTGLDYYIARYYDPAVGVFLSADAVQGNAQGMNPYAYVDGNPETYNDPTGQYFSPQFRLDNGLDGSSLSGSVSGGSRTDSPGEPPRGGVSGGSRTDSPGEPPRSRASGGGRSPGHGHAYRAIFSRIARAAQGGSREGQEATKLARLVRKFRSDFSDPMTGSNFAAAEWYLTDQNGNGDCLFCIDKFGAQPIGFVTKSQGRAFDPNNTGDAEQQLLRNWIRGGGLLMALFFEKLARQVLNVHAILHIVLYTEREPCPQCANFLTGDFKKTTAALGTAVMNTFPYLGPWPSGEIGAQLDVFAYEKVYLQPGVGWQIPFTYGAPAGTA